MSLFQGHKVNISARTPFKEGLSCRNTTCGCRVSNFLWVSHTLSLIYIETPKCGCSTIKSAFDIKITPQIVAEAYFRRLGRNADRDITLSLSPYGFSYKLPVSLLKTDKLRIMKSIAAGKMESEPRGKFQFQHSFDSVKGLMTRFPNYNAICIMRDPIKRFLSGVNMFYSSDFNFDRRMQRLSHSPLTDNDLKDFSKIFSDVFENPNHHFDPVSKFFEDQSADKISIHDISDIDSLMHDICGKKREMRENVSPKYNYSIDMLDKKMLSDLHKFYESDFSLLKSA